MPRDACFEHSLSLKWIRKTIRLICKGAECTPTHSGQHGRERSSFDPKGTSNSSAYSALACKAIRHCNHLRPSLTHLEALPKMPDLIKQTPQQRSHLTWIRINIGEWGTIEECCIVCSPPEPMNSMKQRRGPDLAGDHLLSRQQLISRQCEIPETQGNGRQPKLSILDMELCIRQLQV